MVRTKALGTLAAYSVYLHTGEGWSANNRRILTELMLDVATHQVPFIAAGDWNMPPEMLAMAPWGALKATIVTPQTPTYTTSKTASTSTIWSSPTL